jgi:anaerobic selenocysteine-containing dehydrogenase
VAANRLFRAMLDSPSGVVFARSSYEESWDGVRRGGNRINLAIPEMLEELSRIGQQLPTRDEEFPLVLSAGERRSETANTVIRDTAWHRKGIYAGLRLSPQDAAEIGCEDGDILHLSTRRASVDVIAEISDMMAPGHISLPNGTGLDYTDADGGRQLRGVAPNELTDAASRDFLAGTPWHKHVPARLVKPVPNPGQ